MDEGKWNLRQVWCFSFFLKLGERSKSSEWIPLDLRSYFFSLLSGTLILMTIFRSTVEGALLWSSLHWWFSRWLLYWWVSDVRLTAFIQSHCEWTLQINVVTPFRHTIKSKKHERKIQSFFFLGQILSWSAKLSSIGLLFYVLIVVATFLKGNWKWLADPRISCLLYEKETYSWIWIW